MPLPPPLLLNATHPPTQGQDDDLGTNNEAIELMAQLLKHSKRHPGATFNVGVVPDSADDYDMPAALEQHTSKIQPAVSRLGGWTP